MFAEKSCALQKNVVFLQKNPDLLRCGGGGGGGLGGGVGLPERGPAARIRWE
jgi:hypothetical protein